MKDKKDLRSELLIERRNMKNKIYKDSLIFHSLINNKHFLESEIVFIYCSTAIEIDTWEIIKYCLNNNKTVAVPLSNSATCTMQFYKIKSIDELYSGYYNIMEPKEDVNNLIVPNEKTVMIVPGLSFSNSRNRIGYGKGFYDRYLNRYDCYSIGLCYEENIKNDVLYNTFDKKVNCVITDKSVIQ